MDEYLTKPIKIDDLARTLAAVVPGVRRGRGLINARPLQIPNAKRLLGSPSSSRVESGVSKFGVVACAAQASSARTSLPCTSVRRKSRPWNL